MAKVKIIAKFRQTGWQHKETGDIEVFYNDAKPENLEMYTKKWDNIISEVSEKEKFEETPAVVTAELV